MGWNAFSLRIGTLIGGALLLTFQAAGGPPAGGRGFAPTAHVSAVPRGGGYVNWHAAANTGMHPASWNVGPTHGTAQGWNNNWGYHRGWGNGFGYGYGGARRGVIVPFYYPIVPFFDTGSYGYSDDSGAAPPPPDAEPITDPPTGPLTLLISLIRRRLRLIRLVRRCRSRRRSITTRERLRGQWLLSRRLLSSCRTARNLSFKTTL